MVERTFIKDYSSKVNAPVCTQMMLAPTSPVVGYYPDIISMYDLLIFRLLTATTPRLQDSKRSTLQDLDEGNIRIFVIGLY